MNRQTLQILVEMILAFGGLGGFAIAFRSRAEIGKLRAEASKYGADAAQVLTNAAVSLIPHIREELEDTIKDLAEARARIKILERDLEVARVELHSLRQRIGIESRRIE